MTKDATPVLMTTLAMLIVTVPYATVVDAVSAASMVALVGVGFALDVVNLMFREELAELDDVDRDITNGNEPRPDDRCSGSLSNDEGPRPSEASPRRQQGSCETLGRSVR